MLFLNTLAVFVMVVAKFPHMHKVRIFGINADQWKPWLDKAKQKEGVCIMQDKTSRFGSSESIYNNVIRTQPRSFYMVLSVSSHRIYTVSLGLLLINFFLFFFWLVSRFIICMIPKLVKKRICLANKSRIWMISRGRVYGMYTTLLLIFLIDYSLLLTSFLFISPVQPPNQNNDSP